MQQNAFPYKYSTFKHNAILYIVTESAFVIKYYTVHCNEIHSVNCNKMQYSELQQNTIQDITKHYNTKTSLLQAQTLTNATPPIGKINPFSKIALTFEPMMKF